MRFSFRLLFLILATVLFIVSVISGPENQFDVLGLELAALASAFFVDELNIGGGGGRGR